MSPRADVGPLPPHLVRTIVCGYTRDELPVAWLRVFHRLEHAIARARLRIRVRLDPIEDLPEEIDILVVPPELVARVEALATGARVIGTTRQEAQRMTDELLREIERGASIYAERMPSPESNVATHRGRDPL